MGNEEVRSVIGHLERMEFMVQPTQSLKKVGFFYVICYSCKKTIIIKELLGGGRKMFYTGLFKKRLTIKQGEELLAEHCRVNGFDDNGSQWKKPTHSKHWFSYIRRGHKMISRNWVSYHPTRGDAKYSIWIDLVTQEIREILRSKAYID